MQDFPLLGLTVLKQARSCKIFFFYASILLIAMTGVSLSFLPCLRETLSDFSRYLQKKTSTCPQVRSGVMLGGQRSKSFTKQVFKTIFKD